ncbi:MAG TPA: hypothetical protein VGR11_17170 [Solirubrobacteraceae bacterium]|nr:hypothetical protein [Solirubrobacteraceae bacterium]
MEHTEDAPLADEGRRGSIPDDQPVGGPTGPGDENMPSRPLTPGPGEEGPREPSPDEDQPS